MFKKFMTLTLLVSMLIVASSIGVAAHPNSTGETEAVSKIDESQKVRESFLKKENKSQVTFEEKDNLNNHQKQKSQGKKFSTGTKVLIGVGIAAVVVGVVIFAASRDKVEPFKNGVLQ